MGVLTAAVHVVAAAELVERKKDESLICGDGQTRSSS